jgi:hypothetical protein
MYISLVEILLGAFKDRFIVELESFVCEDKKIQISCYLRTVYFTY